MTDRFSGLTRRVNTLVYERETSEELSHLLEETKEGGEGADAVIEMGLAAKDCDENPETEPETEENPVVTDEDAGLDAVVEDDEEEDAEETALVGDEAPADANGDGVVTDDEAGEDEITDEEIADVANDVEDEAGEDEGSEDDESDETVETEAALKLGEVNII